MLDPDTEKDEFNKLVAEVTNKYGGEVKGYKAILDKSAGYQQSDSINSSPMKPPNSAPCLSTRCRTSSSSRKFPRLI